MSERLKRILAITAFVLVAIGLGYILFRVFFQPAVRPIPAPVGPSATGTLPTAKPGAPQPTPTVPTGVLPSAPGIPALPPTVPTPAAPRTTVLNAGVNNAISLTAGGLRSYNANDGKFYKIKDDGTQVAMSDQTFFNVDTVTWGNVSDKAILTYPDGSKILYDFSTKQQTTLPKHWEDFNFSPQDDHIVAKAIGDNESNRFLVVADPNGGNAHPIEDLGTNQDLVHSSWSPNNQIVAYAFTGDPAGFDRQNIVMVGQHQENFKYLTVEGRGFVPNWSPSGNNILYSVYNSNDNYLPTLWISGANGDQMNANRRSIELHTWADKCAWKDESTVYCAVPVSLDPGAGLQRDLSANVPDNLYKIDVSSGSVVNLGQPEGSPTIKQLIPSADGNALYFNDRNTGQLMRFALNP